MPQAVDARTSIVGVAALATAVWTVSIGVHRPADVVPALLVPAVFVLAGLLGPLWQAARFTCRLLVTIGSLHLIAVAVSGLAQTGTPGSAWWHALSQVLFLGGFGALLPLATGYPTGPAARGTRIVAAAAAALPLLAALAAPTPAVLSGPGEPPLLGPIAAVLPPWVAAIPSVVFALPLAAATVAVIRVLRGDRETRGRLLLPLAALVAFAALTAVSTLLPLTGAAVTTALFLVSAPLIPAGLIAGSRPLTAPLDARPPLPSLPGPGLDVLSPREQEVLAAMAAGESNAAIARRLHMSLSAVEKHTTAIFTKLDLAPDPTTHRRVAAVVAYLRSAAH